MSRKTKSASTCWGARRSSVLPSSIKYPETTPTTCTTSATASTAPMPPSARPKAPAWDCSWRAPSSRRTAGASGSIPSPAVARAFASRYRGKGKAAPCTYDPFMERYPMPTDTIPARSAIDKKYTWNAESMFATPAAWDAEVKAIIASIPDVKKFQGRLKEGSATLLNALKAMEELLARVNRVVVYAGFAYSVDTTDQDAAAMAGKSQGAFGQASAAISFLNPELLEIGEKTLRQWLMDEPGLGIYAHYADDLFREQAHVRSAEVEEILGMP